MFTVHFQAARDKLGGNFPRDSAQEQNQHYLQRLKMKAATKKKANTSNNADTHQGYGQIDLDDNGQIIVRRWLARARNRKVRVCVYHVKSNVQYEVSSGCFSLT